MMALVLVLIYLFKTASECKIKLLSRQSKKFNWANVHKTHKTLHLHQGVIVKSHRESVPIYLLNAFLIHNQERLSFADAGLAKI